MSTRKQGFVEQQRERLEELRKELSDATASQSGRKRAFGKEHGGEARELEDDAQSMSEADIDEAISKVDERRLRAVERALEKISEGTYGLSDISGAPIPEARLKATPEALLTVQEEEQQENRRRP
jgi:DnaK suppressor protein